MENLENKISEIFDANNKYIIPLYQRNYAWGKEQIETLIQDVYEAYKKDNNSNYFVGSLVVLRRHNGDYEVIDGQQRLTTLSLLTKILGITNAPVLYYESRPEMEEFFAEFYQSQDATCKTIKPQTHYLREAVDCIKRAKVLAVEGDVPFEIWSEDKDFKEYLKDNVILIKAEIPEDTDVATYFEIMNNRGEQLQKHEILKARLMDALEPKYHDEFDLIWTACSNIDRPIQQCFNAKDREMYFGTEYKDFVFKGLSDETQNNARSDEGTLSINDILDNNHELSLSQNNNNNNDNDNDNEDAVSSIIDFPNFLMHILKLFAKQKSKDNDNDYRLNEKYMLDCAEKLFGENIDSATVKEFITLLFKSRTLFDRYIIKTKEGKNEDDFSWVLNRPEKYTYDNNNSVKYDLFTFGDTFIQKKLIKAQSMLQVTYRQRIYKNWLQILLEHLNEQECELSKIDGESILKCLHMFMADQYEKLKINFEEIEMYKEGVNTPHFLLNFIDYLYWLSEEMSNSGSKRIKDFDFRYWNSVEHHLAKQYAKDTIEDMEDNIIDCLGNLFLISKNANSRLNDRSVSEKVERFKDRNMGANRQIIYEKGSNWGKDEIIEHYKELKSLLGVSNKILEIENDGQNTLT